jgi:YD repeat-containing protein
MCTFAYYSLLNTDMLRQESLTQFNGYTLQYDSDGNLIHKFKPYVVNQSFSWNSLGQLVQTTTNGLTVSYAYDGFGRWTQYTDPTGTIQYVWDGDNLFLEQNAAGAVTEYTYYPGVDQPHSIKRGSSIHYYVTDFPGNVVGLIGSQQELANEYAYTPFGERSTSVTLSMRAPAVGFGNS